MATKKVTNKIASAPKSPSLLDRMESEVQSNQSRVSLILGGLIVLVVGVLIFNYFNKNSDKSEITPNAEQTEIKEDVSPEKLPGKYTVKEGDTLFTIAQKYYQDGYKFTEIVKANSLTSADVITVGQIIEIPKLAITSTPTSTPAQTPAPTTDAAVDAIVSYGTPITGETYTVVEGDWLSTISARAYNGDVMAYSKIATANNIANPDLIEPGMILTIPR